MYESSSMLNLVVLGGVLARPPQELVLPSGSRIASFEVTVRRLEGPAETVPATWVDPPSWVTGLEAGASVVVSGRVRRRFFRAGGATQSRTEVVVERMARGSARSKVASLLSQAVEVLLAVRGPS